MDQHHHEIEDECTVLCAVDYKQASGFYLFECLFNIYFRISPKFLINKVMSNIKQDNQKSPAECAKGVAQMINRVSGITVLIIFGMGLK